MPDLRGRELPVSVVGKWSLKIGRGRAGWFPDALSQWGTDKPEDLPGRNLTKRGMKWNLGQQGGLSSNKGPKANRWKGEKKGNKTALGNKHCDLVPKIQDNDKHTPPEVGALKNPLLFLQVNRSRGSCRKRREKSAVRGRPTGGGGWEPQGHALHGVQGKTSFRNSKTKRFLL